ncbi:MAG: MMPL family transporter [Actinobacteria bacterium]|nr:MMPL family transporter [Actinomycetota bacterium]MCG2802345.1 MMPL family transporter [Cellulomonas sp.]
MFRSLGRLAARRPLVVIGVWVVLVLAGYALAGLGLHGENLFERVTTGQPQVPGSQSEQGEQILAAASDVGESVTIALTRINPETEGLDETLLPVRAELASTPGVISVVDPLALPGGTSNPAAQPLLAADGDGFLLVAELDPSLTTAEHDAALSAVTTRLHAVPDELRPLAPTVVGVVGSSSLIVSAVTDQVREDLTTGERIALPIALLVMIAVFGGFLAAGIPMAGALASIAGGLATLLGLTYLIDVDAAVVNVVTVLGLGLSIDYGLLMVSRYREELHAILDVSDGGARARRRRGDGAVAQAVETTVATAGRTVTFSAVTVAVSISGLLVFRPSILRAVGAAGVGVVLVALATALTLVPALLTLTGRRLHRPGLLSRVPGVRSVLARTAEVSTDDGAFSRLAARVQRHPWAWFGGALVVLVVLALPVGHLQVRNSGIELLPANSTQRQFVDLLAEQFPATTSPAVTVVARTSVEAASAWSAQLATLDGVRAVDAPVTVGDYVTIGVRATTDDPGDEVAAGIVREIRAADPDFTIWVTGQAANQIDFVSALAAGVWWAVAIVALATLVLLFLMTGSVVIGIKALLTSALSLGASLGVLVWGFQDGHLSGLLGFTSAGGIETYVLAMVIAFAFGLAMDYEVFLLSRVLELHHAGYDDATAVRLGLQRSARIITSAAAIIIVVFGGFVAGQLLIIKEVGFALALAIAVDATLVRMVLVPATMTLLGRANWWAPAPLRRLHARFSLRH